MTRGWGTFTHTTPAAELGDSLRPFPPNSGSLASAGEPFLFEVG